MSALLEPEQDTVLALKLMGMRKTAKDEEFAAVLSQLLGTCRHEGFRIAVKALEIILQEAGKPGSSITEVKVGDQKIVGQPIIVKIPAELKDDPTLKLKTGPITELPPQVRPMRTREEALAVHRQNHPELYNEDGSRKTLAKDGIESDSRTDFQRFVDDDMDALEKATRPDPVPEESPIEIVGRVESGRAKINDAGKAHICSQAAKARLANKGKLPNHWVKKVAKGYDVSDALIYSIIYSDPNYVAIPRS